MSPTGGVSHDADGILAAATASTDPTAPSVTITSPASAPPPPRSADHSLGHGHRIGGRVEVEAPPSAYHLSPFDRHEPGRTLLATARSSAIRCARSTTADETSAPRPTPHARTHPAPPLCSATRPDNPACRHDRGRLAQDRPADRVTAGVRFLKGTGNPGTHAGGLFLIGRLAAARSARDRTGWQTLTSSPRGRRLTYVARTPRPNGASGRRWSSYSATCSASDRAEQLRGRRDRRLRPPARPGRLSSRALLRLRAFTSPVTPPTTIAIVPGERQVRQPRCGQAQFSKQIKPPTLVFTLKDAANVNARRGDLQQHDETATLRR